MEVSYFTIHQMIKRVLRKFASPLQLGHNGRDGVSNHQPQDCLLSRLFRRRSKKTPKLRVTGLCAGKAPVTGEFSAQMISNEENISIWWRHHAMVWQHMQSFQQPDKGITRNFMSRGFELQLKKP